MNQLSNPTRVVVMKFRRKLAQVTVFACGIVCAILLGVCLLLVHECKSVPRELRQRHVSGTRFHALSFKQISFEEKIRLAVIKDSITRLKSRDGGILFSRSIAELERMHAKLSDAGKEKSNLIDCQTCSRLYAYDNEKEAGIAHLAWVDERIVSVIEGKPQTECLPTAGGL